MNSDASFASERLYCPPQYNCKNIENERIASPFGLYAVLSAISYEAFAYRCMIRCSIP